MSLRQRLGVCGAILAAAYSLFAADATIETVPCSWTDTPIVIDGQQEGSWSKSHPIAGTGFRALWDREYLYLLSEEVKDLEFVIRPDGGKTGQYKFLANVTNVIQRFLLTNLGEPETIKQVHLFEIGTARAKVMELKIPWRNFLRTGGRPAQKEGWKFTVGETSASIRFDGPAPLSREKWHNDKLVGSPDPPPAYRTIEAFPKLKVEKALAIAVEPGTDRLIFIEHSSAWGGGGRIKRFTPETNAAEVLLEINETVYGLAFHPGFVTNGYIFFGCNGPVDGKQKFTRAVRYTMDRVPPFQIQHDSRKVIIEWESDGHNGGDLVFGNDGMLYVTSGDGTSDSDKNIVGQDLSTLLAKVLRIDVDHPDAGRNYGAPKDNPFLDRPGARPETWAYGLRNPWRITSDRATGQIWIGENGQDLWEMARLLVRGANYGWSVYEGSHEFYPLRKLGPDPVTFPTIEHPHSEARSLTGGIVYNGSEFPELRGAYIYGDYSTGKIWAGRHDGKRLLWHKELVDTSFALTGFGSDTHGELLIIDEGTGFHRLRRNEGKTNSPAFPRKLSETGLFVSTAPLKPHPGLIPYDVNSPLWSDGAEKARYLALPGDAVIEFTHNRGWALPDGSVLVKTFALPMESRSRRLETRLLVKAQKEWVGYTYIWNDEQTDATLLGAEGTNRVFTSGNKTQDWRFPSRTECMVCHSRAANYVLGLTEAQMNRPYSYADGEENQLVRLERLGLLRVNWQDYEKDAVSRELKERKIETDNLENAKSQRRAPETTLLPRNPSRMRKLADPYLASAPLADRARSYLQSNCAQCHVEAGGGNALMELEFQMPLEKMNVVDVSPRHHTFDIPEAKLVAKGDPARSVLLHRISHRDAGHMPPLGTSVVDQQAVQLLQDWIKSLGKGE